MVISTAASRIQRRSLGWQAMAGVPKMSRMLAVAGWTTPRNATMFTERATTSRRGPSGADLATQRMISFIISNGYPVFRLLREQHMALLPHDDNPRLPGVGICWWRCDHQAAISPLGTSRPFYAGAAE